MAGVETTVQVPVRPMRSVRRIAMGAGIESRSCRSVVAGWRKHNRQHSAALSAVQPPEARQKYRLQKQETVHGKSLDAPALRKGRPERGRSKTGGDRAPAGPGLVPM